MEHSDAIDTHDDQVEARGARPSEPTITIVVPALNEAKNLGLVLPALPPVHEVILVDGNSTDGTIDVATKVLPEVRILRQSRRGKGNALVEGIEAATGDVVVLFDADGSANPDEIPLFVDALKNGADVAKGSRNLNGGGSADITRIRRMGNLGLLMLSNQLFKTSFTDLCYGYNAFWRDIVEVLDLPPGHQDGPSVEEMLWGDGFEIETLLNCRFASAGLRVAEVPSRELPRMHGVSNLNAVGDGMRVLRTLLYERRRMSFETPVAEVQSIDVTSSRESVEARQVTERDQRAHLVTSETILLPSPRPETDRNMGVVDSSQPA